jgi:MFS family permease
MRLAKATLIWAALVASIGMPIAFAATSDLLEWRGPVYILAGFAGIIALGLLLVQPLLIGGYLPGLSAYRGRRAHHWIGGVLVVAVVLHVGGLWITSPPDMIDALLFTSPTPLLPLRCDRHVGDLRCGAFGCTPPAIGTATANVAHRPYSPRGGHRRRGCGPRHADRRDDGDGVEGGPLRAGPRGGHKSHG